MENSPHFWFNVASCAVLCIMLWAACAGIGYQILPRLRTQSDEAGTDGVEPVSWRQPGVAACVGLGVLLFLGGIGVVLRIPWWLFVVPFLATGLVLAMTELRRFAGRRGPFPRSAWIIGGLAIVAFGLVALTQGPVGFRFPLNVCDDWRAYLPYAHRLLDTGGLEEPWSLHRVQTLGGFDLLRALPVAVFGDEGVGVAETVIASVFLAGLFVANGWRSTWARLLSVGLIIAVPFLYVPRTNTTGVLIGIPLLVVVLATTAELRRALRAGARRDAVQWSIAAGLVIASLMSVRPNLGLLGAVYLTLGALAANPTGVRARVQVLAAGGATTLVAVAPWSFAMWRTAGTPLYPLFAGNLNGQALQSQPVRGLSDLAEHVYDLVSVGPYLWVTLGVFVAALLAWKLLPDAMLVVLAAAATAAITFAFAFSTPTAPPLTFIRYIAPMCGGLVVFLLCEVIRGLQARPEHERGRTPVWAIPALAAGIAVGLCALAFSGLGIHGNFVLFPAGRQMVELAARDQLSRPGLETSTPALRRSFRRAMRSVDPDVTIVAVDRPYLIDYSRYDVPNLDAPGSMTPDGGAFPFFTGPGPKIAQLRRAGFRTLVVTNPVNDLCLSPSRLVASIKQRPNDHRVYSRLLDWDNDLSSVAQQAPGAVRRYGTLLVIDLRKAQRDLKPASS